VHFWISNQFPPFHHPESVRNERPDVRFNPSDPHPGTDEILDQTAPDGQLSPLAGRDSKQMQLVDHQFETFSYKNVDLLEEETRTKSAAKRL
jgi:hypothetical protein